MLSKSLEEVKKLRESYNKIPVSLEMYMDFQTPIAVLSCIKERYDRYFLLESIQGGEKIARYTFIGFNPHASFYVKEGCSFFATREELKRLEGNPLDRLKEIMSQYKAPKDASLPPLTGGAIGYFGYEAVRYMENIPFQNKNELQVADIKLMFFNQIIAFDHLNQKLFLIANIDGEALDLEEAYKEAEERLLELANLIGKPIKRRKVQFDEELIFKSNTTKEAFMARVEKAKEYIANGDIFQVVLSQIFKAKMTSNLFDVYRVLRTVNPSPYMYLMQFDDLQLAGASPETLVKVQNGMVTTMPIAGTRPRGKTKEEDLLLDKELLSDPKELAEHTMLVDLARNDIGKISDFKSVLVEGYRVLKKFSHVTHITSTVNGRLKKELTSIDAIQAILPAGTLSGAPKVRAMEIIEELEEERRGIYGGGIGYIGFDGNLDTCIAIRTVVKKDGIAYVQAGGGIVLDSNPELEYEESVNKATALFVAMKKVREIV
ncbi:anthranilate synthase component I [Sporanaerobium hydrogeniformans]|uniref:Anthranilate synthase component I n=1 Tax=Sporanaerobium hydrogeniformans TaxID=3072179 RepID=A0AC61DBW3_9FIRM|nr:anthranilate synthase component I [Sporanaerobium hydrogeniformans]PHV70223.1 anthranilate synthase component I [Sporanaerobium hydrogeniformans]